MSPTRIGSWCSVSSCLAIATERDKRIAAPEVEIKEVRRQAAAISAKNGRLEGGLDHAESELEVARKYREAQASKS